MKDSLGSNRVDQLLKWLLIILPCLFPLLFSFPYRINVFLAWDGAFRISQGLIPYKDFGTPVGYAFWLIPSLFFKIFGNSIFTLIVAQVFINFISNLVFYNILRLFNVSLKVSLIGLWVYNLSYTLFNPWPWYNHSVFVFELISLYFLLRVVFYADKKITKTIFTFLFISAFVSVLTFLCKQDTGALSIVFNFLLIIWFSIFNNSYKVFFVYLGMFIFSLIILILPFLQYDFLYWFNLGQYPHTSRVSAFDLLHEFFGASKWIKFYLMFVILLFLWKHDYKACFDFKKPQVFFLWVLFILFQASIIQVTSYTPLYGNIYFHAIALTFLFVNIDLGFEKSKWIFISGLLLSGIWWSNVYWTRYISPRVKPLLVDLKDSDRINKNTYVISAADSLNEVENRTDWIVPPFKVFSKIKIPLETSDGIQRLLDLSKNLNKVQKLKVLNLTELTQLSVMIPYEIETGEGIPLWYHKGVSIFDKEVKDYCNKINNDYYDIILFEDIPNLNQFYSYDILNCVKEKYHLVDSFLAPRVPVNSFIFVFIKQ